MTDFRSDWMHVHVITANEHHISIIDQESNLLPFPCIQWIPNKYTIPLIDERWLKVKSAADKLQGVVSLAFAYGQNTCGQSGPEPQLHGIPLNELGVYDEVGRATKWEGGGVSTEASCKARLTVTLKVMLGLIEEEGFTGASVETSNVLTANQSHRAVLASIAWVAGTVVISHFIFTYSLS